MLRERRIVTVATDEELRLSSYRNRLKLAVRNTGIGQRDWPTAIQDMFLRADMQGIEFQYANGKRFEIPLVDDVWRNERYVREFLASDACEHLQKDRLLDVFLWTEMLNSTRKLGR